MRYIDLNCDMGEGVGNEETIMPWISSANIACGYHAGDENIMQQIIKLCLKYKVGIGAHPSFPDRANFGRKEMQCTTTEVYSWVQEQVMRLQSIAFSNGAQLHHVKPHGALYNVAAKNPDIARAIAGAVKDIDRNLILVGLSGSYSIQEAKAMGLQTANEVFADRTYQEDGSLTQRLQAGALIENESDSIAQVLQMVNKGSVHALSGKEITLEAQTICLHGDSNHTVVFAKAIHQTIKAEGISIKPLAFTI